MHGNVVTVVIAIVALLLVAAVAAIGLKRINLPYTVGLVILGLLLGALTERFETLEPLRSVTLSPEIILFVFLPTLIFESAFKMDSRLLSQNLAPVLSLAAPGLLLSTAIVGGLVAWLTPLPLGAALVFGALISATDPVAVIALFHELGAPKRLEILVEGESLFNDATAIVLFGILLAVVTEGGDFAWGTVGHGATDFVRVFVGGLLVGGLIGYLMIRSIALAHDEPLVEVAISTVVAYTAFIAAEHYLHVSGVMATVGAGVVIGTLGSTRFSGHVREYLHQFWEYAAFVANSLIFLLVGMSIPLGELTHYAVPIVIAIGAMLVARAVVIFGLVPVASRLPGAEPIGLKYQSVLFWGGLRGAVALALALSLPEDLPQRELIISLAIGAVLFTLVTGGLTMAPLMSVLGLDQPTLVEKVARAQAALAGKREALARVTGMGTAGHFSTRLLRDLEQRYRGEESEAEALLENLRRECRTEEIRGVLWSEALAVERTVYRDLFESGAISEPVLRELELGVDLQRDGLKRGEIPHGMPGATPIELRLVDWATRLAGSLLPRSQFVQTRRVQALAAKYERDAAVLEASRRVMTEIDHIAELAKAEPGLADECRREYESRSFMAMKRIDSVAEHFPEFVRAVQAQTAHRMALDGEADAVEKLATAGLVPESIARETRVSVKATQRQLQRHPVSALRPDPRDLLSRVPFFQNLKPDDFERVLARLVPRTVLTGETIIRQGARGDSLFLIARGVVAVLITKDGTPPQRVASLHAGDFFGEMALLTAAPRTATVQAVTDCQLYELSKQDVDALCEVCPGVKEALMEAYRARKSAD